MSPSANGTPTAQQMQALERGNAVRLEIASRRQQLRSLPELDARRYAADMIDNPDDIASRMKASVLVKEIRHFGDQKVARILRLAGIHAVERRLSDLTDRQRHIIAEALRDPRKINNWSQLPRVEETA